MTTHPDLGDASAVTDARPKGILSRLVHRLTADNETLDAEDLESVTTKSGCQACRSVTTGMSVQVTGRIRSVRFTPSEQVPTLTAEMFDGTGSVELIWLGRRRIPGIEPGREVVATGRIADHAGCPTLYNPRYELLPSN